MSKHREINSISKTLLRSTIFGRELVLEPCGRSRPAVFSCRYLSQMGAFNKNDLRSSLPTILLVNSYQAKLSYILRLWKEIVLPLIFCFLPPLTIPIQSIGFSGSPVLEPKQFQFLIFFFFDPFWYALSFATAKFVKVPTESKQTETRRSNNLLWKARRLFMIIIIATSKIAVEASSKNKHDTTLLIIIQDIRRSSQEIILKAVSPEIIIQINLISISYLWSRGRPSIRRHAPPLRRPSVRRPRSYCQPSSLNRLMPPSVIIIWLVWRRNKEQQSIIGVCLA